MGASRQNLNRIMGLSSLPSSNMRSEAHIRQSKKSTIYPILSEFSERRLVEAAKMNMSTEDASRYAGSSQISVRGFWRRIGHNYITPRQEASILAGINEGLSVSKIASRARVLETDVKYFIEIKDLEYSSLPPSDVKNAFWNYFDVVDKVERLVEIVGRPITSADFAAHYKTSFQVTRIKLKRACKDGLLRRRAHKGREFIYYPVGEESLQPNSVL